MRGLEQDQQTRRTQHPEASKQIDVFILKLKELKDLKTPFQLVSIINIVDLYVYCFLKILDDISGNSYIENPNAPQKDENCICGYFKRNTDQDHDLGIFSREEVLFNHYFKFHYLTFFYYKRLE